MKLCSFCAEEIQDAAVKCKHCGEMLEKREVNKISKKALWIVIISGITIVMFIFAILFIFLFISHNKIKNATIQGHLTACKSNLKNIGISCEMFSTDHQGNYPSSYSELIPEYLSHALICPAANQYSYNNGYEVSDDRKTYTIYCCGNYHPNCGINYPKYDSVSGLIEKDWNQSSGSIIPINTPSNLSAENYSDLYQITYKITGDVPAVTITYINEQGATIEEKQVKLPWSKTLMIKKGNQISISAQNERYNGSIVTEIHINGNLYKTTTASGAYCTATAKGMVE